MQAQVCLCICVCFIQLPWFEIICFDKIKKIFVDAYVYN